MKKAMGPPIRKKCCVSLLIAAFFLLSLCRTSTAQAKVVQEFTQCDVNLIACTKDLPNGKIILDITPKPVRAMKELTFRLSVSGLRPQSAPFIDLGMPGMHMGPNRVLLEATGDHTYSGKGIIVKCPSGRRTWFARITLPGVTTVAFVFDVLY